MRRLLVLALALVLVPAAAASAATPASGSVSLAAPATTWTGTAPGYGVIVVNALGVRTCLAPACDQYTLDVKDAGDLRVRATSGTGFTDLVVVRPDGTQLVNGGAADQPTSELAIKNAKPGRYLVRVTTNRTLIADASYHAMATLGAPATGGTTRPPLGQGEGEGGRKDATVVAVIDSSFNPYHWDFAAAKMPQATNADPGDDLPLDRPASEWLPGFSGAAPQPVALSLADDDPDATLQALREADSEKWDAFPSSTPAEPQLRFFPHTKVIGAATFVDGGRFVGDESAHGLGTTSAAVGNLHGTCPECLVVMLQYSGEAAGEAAIEWAEQQPWIDVISNSYGFHVIGDDVRDNVYAGADTTKQLAATRRGQQILFSAGNGIENAFVVPNSTELSSQKGPDWILTVGAVSPPEDGVYETFTDPETTEESGQVLGAGKPVDVAAPGYDYPTAYTATKVGETGSIGFSGTSNATPVVAGTYARSLHAARTRLAGESRVQSGGVIARGPAIACGQARPGCELGDGVLTRSELERRLLHGAVPSAAGITVAGLLVNPTLPRAEEPALAGEGHGAFLGRISTDATAWVREQFRVTGPLFGEAAALTRPAGERDWFVVDSYCRQQDWGAWEGGYWRTGDPLPGVSPLWPVRSLREQTCPGGPVPGS